MSRRFIKYIMAALLSLLMVVPTMGSAHADTLCDTTCIYNQLRSGGFSAAIPPQVSYNSDKSVRSYVGTNGLEIRYGRDATWGILTKVGTVAALVVTDGALGVPLTIPELGVAIAVPAKFRLAAAVFQTLAADSLSKIAENALRWDSCLGVTIPPDAVAGVMKRAVAIQAGGVALAAVIPAAPDDVKVWFEPCSNERAAGQADTVSPALGIMSGNLQEETSAQAIPVTGGSVSTMAPLGRDVLTSGQKMYPNQYLTSIDGRFVLALQGDGNLVAYGPGYKPIWSSGTSGRSVDCLLVQGDGNVVLYGKNGSGPIWATNTNASGGASLKMQEDGNLVAYNSNAVAMWSTGTGQGTTGGSYIGSDHLSDDQWLRPGQYLRSADFRYTLFMQNDGNLVLWAPGKRVIWSSNTGGRSGVDGLLQQGDANLVLYAHGAIWSTGLGGPGPHKLLLQNDGNLVVYGSNGGIWSTGTANKI